LDELITEFQTSPLRRYYPYLYTDALYLKVFDGVRFVSKAVMIAIGINEEGYRKIRSTNVLERFNKEVKRRTKVVGAFPCDGSVLRLLIPLGVDTNAKWLDRKYVS
jgi:transposase-like protein